MKFLSRPISVLTLALALAATLPAQLSGVYTINPVAPAAGGNFQSLATAAQALITQGVAGPVMFQVFDDGGPYTESMPFVTNNVAWGTNDAVLSLEHITGTSPSAEVTFQPAPGEQPVIDATGRAMGIFVGGADNLIIEGFEIRNAEFDAVSLYAEAQHGIMESVVIRGCKIHDCGGSGVVVYGNLPHPQNTRIENNFFYNLQKTGLGGFASLARFGYVSARRSAGTVVVHNTFYVSTASGGSSFAVIGSQPGSLTDFPFAQVRNNIIVKLAGQGSVFLWPSIGGVSAIPQAQDGNVVHNLSGSPFAIFGNNGVNSAPNLASWRSASALSASSLEADPLLAAPAFGDLRLSAESPCIDAGVSGTGVLVDIENDLRTVIPDVGADEAGAMGLARAVGIGNSNSHSNGLVPVLASNGPPTLGNTNFNLVMNFALPNSQAWLFASLGAGTGAPIGDGNTLWLDLPSMFTLINQGDAPVGPFLTGNTGTIAYNLPISTDPALDGLNLTVQGVVLDGGRASGIVTTNALDLLIR